MSFSVLGLCDELLKTLAEKGYTKPSPIQTEAVPAVLSERDVMAVAQTGTGKTAAFALPVLQLLSGRSTPQPQSIRALVITPTRELAAQVATSIQIYSRHLNIRCAAVFGGVRIEPQIAQLQAGVDVLVATPGRLLDLYQQHALNFAQLEILVLDEADHMLELGFIDDIRRIQLLLPKQRQTLMFSATFSDNIKSLAKAMLNNPLLIEVAAANNTVETIKQLIHPVDKKRKSELLIHLIKQHKWPQVLVFSSTKHGAESLALQLEKAGISAAAIHANRTQHARTLALHGFRNGNIKVLVATDIAARGIDINQLPCVINLDLPYVAEDYVHRIGRTGRAGNAGLAISLFSEDETKQLLAIERLTGHKFKPEIIPGFALSYTTSNTTSNKTSVTQRLAPSKKPPANSSDDDEYGNFEADVTPRRRGQPQGRKSRGGK